MHCQLPDVIHLFYYELPSLTKHPIQVVAVLADLQRIVLVNIYAPNDANQQVSFFKELQEHLREFSEETIIIGGDFNCTLSEIDKKGGNPNPRKQRVIEEINKLCDLYDLNDSWRVLNPRVEQFTWRNKSFKVAEHSF